MSFDFVEWTDDPLAALNEETGLPYDNLAVYIQEIQNNTNFRQEQAGRGLNSWKDASVGEDFTLEHIKELKNALDDRWLLDYFGYARIDQVIGHRWTALPENVDAEQKIGGFEIINDMRRVIDLLIPEPTLYVADVNNDRIIETDIFGKTWTAFGSSGSGVGQFSAPYKGAYDSDTGFFYIPDVGNHRIIKTNIDGSEIAAYGTEGSGVGQFEYPDSLDYDPATGYLYIADYGNYRIVRTKMDGSGWLTYGVEGDGVGQFEGPSGISFDPGTGFLYITDDGRDQAIRTKMDGSGWATLGSSGSGVYQFNGPSDIDYDPRTGFFYVADTWNHRIVKSKINGSGWQTYGSLGINFGQFVRVLTVAYNPDSDYIYVSDSARTNPDFFSHRITKTTMTGGGWKRYGLIGGGAGVGEFDFPEVFLAL